MSADPAHHPKAGSQNDRRQRALIRLVYASIIAMALIATFFMLPSPNADAGPVVVHSGSCGTDVEYTHYSDGLLSITYVGSGDGGAMNDFSPGTPPWHAYVSSITSLSIGDKITHIGNNAFYGCNGFEGSLTIPDSVVSIGNYAFCECATLSGSLTIPASVVSIGNYAFYGCWELSGSLTIPDSVVSIGNHAFYGCSGFTGSLTIGDSVETIGDSAFGNCYGFTGSLTIPDSVTYIGFNAFGNCYGFTGSLTIGDHVKTIGDHAFYRCYGFTGSLTIGDHVKTIGDHAFDGCSRFTGSLTIPDSVVSIGNYAFSGCSGFKGSLTIGDRVETIGGHAFVGCYGFTGSLTIPDSVVSIGEWAFYGCSGFTGSLTIPDSVVSIGEWAFYGCYRSTGSLTIGDHVETIGDCAFYGCTGFTGSLTIPSSVTYIGVGAFSECSGFNGSLTIPDSVVSIGEWAFHGCTGFTGSLTIPSSVTYIGSDAFSGCSGFTGSLTIPDSVTYIGSDAFSGCSGFTSLTIPSSVTSIGVDVFAGCSSLTYISFPDNTWEENVSMCFPDTSFHQNGAAIASPSWDDVKGKVWQGSGNGHLFNGDIAVELDPQGGTCEPSISATYGQAYGGLPVPTAPSGSVDFAGWFTSPSGGTEVTAETTVMYADSPALYAHWSLKTCTVTFYGNGSTSGSMAAQQFTYGVAQSLTANAFGRTGYTFSNWSTNQAGGGMQYADGQSVTVYGDTDLYAQWTPITYTVAFDGNGSSAGSMDPQQFTYDVPENLISGSFIKGGYVFVGWAKTDTGDVEYDDGQEVVNLSDTQGATVTLFAVWESAVCTVEFKGNGSTSGSMAPQDFDHGVEEDLRPNAFSKTGYTFDGWAKTAKGEVEYTDGQSIAITKDMTLYAHWTANTYTVTFDGNGSTSGSMAAQQFTYDAAQSLTANAFSKTGCTFDGWAKTAAGDVEYTDGQEVSNLTATPNGIVTLYAHWTANECTVTFDYQGGSGSVQSMNVTYGSEYGELPAAARTGYTLDGWFTESEGGAEVESTTIVSTADDHVLYAHWTANTYTVTFDGNGSTSGSMAAQQFTYDAAQSLTANDFARTGYTFTGWAKTSEGDAEFTDGQEVSNLTATPDGIVTLYAHWTANEYTVTFDYQGGSGDIGSMQVTYGQAYGDLPATSRTGYSFDGWFTEPEGGAEVESTTIVSTADDHVLYAHWTANEYTVTFDYQGGSGSVQSMQVTYDTEYGELPDAARTGYTLDGWFTEPEGGAEVESTTIVSTADDHVLYAHWTANEYTVTFDYQGGSGDIGSMQVTYDTEYGELPAAARTGYSFDGWFTEPEGGAEVESTTIVSTADDHILYAHWTANTYTVTFDGNGSTSGSMTAQQFTYGVAQSLKANAFSKTGYTFDGWAKTAAGDVEYTDGQKVRNLTAIPDGTVTLYAHWSLKTFTVTFYGNGSTSGSMAAQQFTYGVAQSLTANAFGRTGYTFSNWSTNQAGGGTQYVDGQSVTVYADTDLYAQWTPITYTVAFDGNGSTSGSMAAQQFTYGVAQSLAANEFARTGYTFTGWAKTSEGDAEFTDGQEVSNLTAIPDGTVTLYAHWTANEYTVTFDYQGGSGDIGSMQVTYGSDYGELPAAARAGYSFDGWFTSTDGKTQVTSSTKVTTTIDHTLYAIWTKEEHFINPDGSETVRKVTETVNDDGSKVTRVSEVTTWNDGSSVVKESEMYEKEDPDGSSVRKLSETVVATDADGNVTTTERTVVSNTSSSGATKTTESTRIESDTESTRHTKVTDVTADGKVTVSDSILSTLKDYEVVTTARSETTPERTVAVATTVIHAGGGILDAGIAAAAMANLDHVTAMLGIADVDATIMVDATDAVSVSITGEALEEFADTGHGLRLVFEDGMLYYDVEAARTMSKYEDVAVSLTKDDRSVLTDAQKEAVGGASFVSVSALSGEIHIVDLGGTVSISYVFQNPQGWEEYAAYHIAENGKKTAMEWTYDEGTGMATIYSTYHSIFAILEKTETSGSGIAIWIAIGIVIIAIAAAAFFVARSKKA